MFTVLWILLALSTCIFWVYSRVTRPENLRVWPTWIKRVTDIALATAIFAFLYTAIILGQDGAHPTAQMSSVSLGEWWLMWPILVLGLIVAFIALCISLLFSLNPNGIAKLYLARIQIFVFVAVSFVGVMENFPDA